MEKFFKNFGLAKIFSKISEDNPGGGSDWTHKSWEVHSVVSEMNSKISSGKIFGKFYEIPKKNCKNFKDWEAGNKLMRLFVEIETAE